jgi:hypothetical protein
MLSRNSVELLLDLVENRLETMEIYDREDRRVIKELEQCRRTLQAAVSREPLLAPAENGNPPRFQRAA